MASNIAILADHRPQTAPAKRPPRSRRTGSSRLSAYMHKDGSLEIRKADRCAPPGAIALRRAFGPGLTPAIRNLFVKKPEERGFRALEAAFKDRLTDEAHHQLAGDYIARIAAIAERA